MIITTDRLVIRPWRRADLDAMAAWPRYPDPLDAVWNWPHVLVAQGTADFFFFGRDTDPTRREWTIVQADQVIGQLGLRQINRAAGSARIGIALGLPYIGQGYGAEALSAFGNAFFGPLGFRRMLLDVRAYNQRALRLYAKLGFREIAQFWYEAGPPEEWAFLDQPRYNSVRNCFRWTNHSVLVQHLELSLDAADWPARRP